MEVLKSIQVSAPAEEIWPFFIEPDKILQWYSTFQKFEYTGEQCSGVGAPIYIEEKAAGPLMKMNFVVTEWEENEVFAIRMEPGPGPKAYAQRWSIESLPSGSRINFWEEIQLPFGFLGKILERFGQRISEGTVEKILAELKRLVETKEMAAASTAP